MFASGQGEETAVKIKITNNIYHGHILTSFTLKGDNQICFFQISIKLLTVFLCIWVKHNQVTDLVTMCSASNLPQYVSFA